MRRPVMYVGGLLLATGASLAFAGPASAAASGGECDPFGDTFLVRSHSSAVNHVSHQNLSVARQDNRRFGNVGLLNVGTSQGDNSGALGVIGSIVK